MGQSSSALYRYFPNRDELLTALILDAYNDLGAAVEEAEARVARRRRRARLVTAARAVRSWSLEHPHEYALIFGSPVPGYVAPEATIAAATRVTIVLARIVDDEFAKRGVRTPPPPAELSRLLEWDQIRLVAPHVPADTVVSAIAVWTLIFGAVSFELFGHYVGSVRDPSRTFDHVMTVAASLVSLTDDPARN